MSTIHSFKDLFVWQKGHLVVLEIYKVTQSFPKSELFGLTNQLRRAAVSITSNIAEGFSRRSSKEKIQFYFMAYGSLSEVENQLQIAKDIGYLDEDLFEDLMYLVNETGKLLNGLINKTKLR